MSTLDADRKMAFRLLQPFAGERVIDCGCGDGEIALHIADAGAQITAMDISTSKIFKLSQKKHNGMDVHCGDLTNMPQEWGQSFDKALCHYVLEHLTIKDAYLAFKEIHRILKPNGKLVLTVPINDNWPHRRLIYRMRTGMPYSMTGHIVSYSMSGIEATINAHNFRISRRIAMSYLGLPSLPCVATRAVFSLQKIPNSWEKT